MNSLLRHIPAGRHTYQFSLRLAFLVINCTCVISAWFAWNIRSVRKEGQAIQIIRDMGATYTMTTVLRLTAIG